MNRRHLLLSGLGAAALAAAGCASTEATSRDTDFLQQAHDLLAAMGELKPQVIGKQ